MAEVYALLGCTKQSISYWAMHAYSTQPKKSVYGVISRAAELFALSVEEAEALANSAGLSLQYQGGDLVESLGYQGKRTELCSRAMISERMLRLYKTRIPTKETLLALAVTLCNDCAEIDTVLHRYGYCLSDSIVGDLVVRWYVTNNGDCVDGRLIYPINETLSDMGLPLLMTKQV